MNVTITLLIYWSIAAGLIVGGLFTLAKGFQLVLEGKGKTKEESSIEFLGIKASVGSIGSLVMVTAFMWGWAAKLALPNYKDADVEIHALRKELMETETALVSLNEENAAKIAKVEELESRLATASLALKKSQMTIATAMGGGKVKEKELLQTLITQQREIFAELQAAVKSNDRVKIEKKSMEFEENAMAVEKTVKDIFDGE